MHSVNIKINPRQVRWKSPQHARMQRAQTKHCHFMTSTFKYNVFDHVKLCYYFAIYKCSQSVSEWHFPSKHQSDTFNILFYQLFNVTYMNNNMCLTLSFHFFLSFLAFCAWIAGRFLCYFFFWCLTDFYDVRRVNRYSIFLQNDRGVNVVRQAVINHYAGRQKQFKAAKCGCRSVTKVRNTYCSESAAKNKVTAYTLCVWGVEENMNILYMNKTKHGKWRKTFKIFCKGWHIILKANCTL